MDSPILIVAMRFVHLVSMALVVGGMAFLPLCLWRATRLLDEDFRDRLMGLTLRLFHRVVLIGIAGLLVSGIFNWIRLAAAYKALGPIGNILIGVKVLLAMVIFGVAIARMAGLLSAGRFWLMFNLHLAAVVMVLGSVLMHLRTLPTAS